MNAIPAHVITDRRVTMRPAFRTLADCPARNKIVLVRADLNVPVHDGNVIDATRIDRLLPTLRALCSQDARIVILSHFGRPRAGKPDLENSLRPVAEELGRKIGRPVAFSAECIGPQAETAVARLRPGEILVLENLRFHAGEESNDPAFTAALARLGHLYVNDAFSTSHRAHASISGLPAILPAYAGLAMEAELQALDSALENPARPLAAIVGGAKISTKLAQIANLTAKVDRLILGGAMANTFLAARGLGVGRSLYEPEMLETARSIMDGAHKNGCQIFLPVDVVTAPALKHETSITLCRVGNVPADGMILDIGTESVTAITAILRDCSTLVWNGPVGAFEISPFDTGSIALAQAVAELTQNHRLKTIAGGGDTVAALTMAGVVDQLSYVSTAGGAFLEWMEGIELPGIKALIESARK